MHDLIKPIETKYKGYSFRSRLEARWAVFFEELGIKYLYEHEGYDLTEINKDPAFFVDGDSGPRLRPDETWYLPDFYLPDYKWYFEIKPNKEAVTDGALDKCILLSTEHHIGIITGSPWADEYIVTAIFSPREAMHGWFAEGRKCDRLWLVNIAGDSVGLDCNECWSPKCKGSQTWIDRGLEKAYDAAKAARF